MEKSGLLGVSRDSRSAGNEYLYLRLADEILTYISNENIQEGERLPSERTLAEQFGTSRTSVREAVRILENRGILEIRIGSGMYLKRGHGKETYNIELWKINYAELLEVKKILELAMIDELCVYFPPADRSGVEEALRELEFSHRSGRFNHTADVFFHRRLRNCCRNFTMIQLLDNLIKKLDDYALQSKEFETWWYETTPYHRQMLEAILEKDPGRAKEAYLAIYELDRRALEEVAG